MKHLSSYKKIEEICKRYNIKNWSIGKDGLVDVDGDVNLSFKNLEKLPLNFGEIQGFFNCHDNKLTSLEGAPRKINSSFNCYDNKLTSLEGGPKKVGGFYCMNNGLITLEGAPKEIDGDFYCESNELTSLKGSPEKVSDYFSCSNNKLTSLEGAPEKVGGDFYCFGNKLTSLKGGPKEVGDDFDCASNNLTSLEGVPFDAKHLNCWGNPINEIWKFIDDAKYLQEFVEVYDVVRPGKVVILEYLNDIRKLMDKKPVEREEIPSGWKILDI